MGMKRHSAMTRRDFAKVTALGALSLGSAMSLGGCSSPMAQASEGASCAAGAGLLPEEGASGAVTLVAVGDNLVESALADYARDCARETGRGAYDYRPIYEPIRPYIEKADLAYLCQEVHLGGDDIGPRGWPSFNAPDDLADALVDTGFDLVASASNHCYDWGNYGALEHSCELWAEKPVVFAGTAASQEAAECVPVVERGGISFALIDFTYGLNGFSRDDVEPWAVSFLDEDVVLSAVARARDAADVVIAAVHWGTEQQMEPDDDQLSYARLLADAGVHVVLGSHPHVIGPVEWHEGFGGHRTLVAYALGDFKSNHSKPTRESELAGMLSCEFSRQADGSVVAENPRWTPLVNHIEEGAHAVYALPDYTEGLAQRHAFLSTQDDPIGWMRETSERVVNSRGAGIPIVT